MNTPENTRYWETAEYNTTVEAAQKAAGRVTPTDCLTYELEQYVAVCSKHFHYSDDSQGGRPERLSANHPDYPRRLAECRESAEQQLARAYELREQELADEWATAHERNPPDERLRLALQLKESAHRLLDRYADYLVLVGVGRLVLTSTVPSFLVRGTAYPKDAAARLRHVRERVEKAMYGYIYDAGPYSGLDRGLIVGAAGAAELAHFYRLLAAFHIAEQAPTPPTAIPVDFSLYIKEEYREKLIPFLKQKYTGQKSRAVTCMLLALHDLEALKNSPHNNKMRLHESLKAFFGKVGTRQALSTNLKDLEFAKGNEHLQIEAHRKSILDFMEQE